jgi:hypothetical protein
VVTRGAALIGHVLREGKPVKHITLGVVSVDRAMNFTGDFITGTGEDGRFIFPNLQPGREYAAYGLMESLKGIGALPTRIVRAGGDSSTNNVEGFPSPSRSETSMSISPSIGNGGRASPISGFMARSQTRRDGSRWAMFRRANCNS